MSYNRDQDEEIGKAISVYGQETENDEDELSYLHDALKDAEFEREQYKATRDDLLHHLCMALPFVEDALEDPCYKPGSTKKVLEAIRNAIAKAEATPSSPDL